MAKMQEPLTFKRGLTIKNRVVIPPMTTRMSYFDGVVTNDEIQYYAMRTGEVGLFITGVANIQPNGLGWTGELGVYDDKFIPGLSKLAAAMKQGGTKAILQIFHAGRMTNRRTLGGEQPVSASAVAAERPGADVPREMSEEEILEVIENFKKATERAIKAGFDGVEIHGANHYLLHQFFSPHSNRRTDTWGGTLEKRFTLLEKVVDGVIDVVDTSGVENFVVGYRFSPREETSPGFNLEETLYLVDKLADKKLDYLHVSLTRYDGKTNLSAYQEKSMLQYIHEKINGRIPLISVGSIWHKDDLEKALAHSEMAAVGSAYLLNPRWLTLVLAGAKEQIKETIHPAECEQLMISNGVWGFLEMKIPERLVK